MKKLNLGCGDFRKKGYVNVDVRKSVKPDVVHDLNKLPYPFKNNEFDLIEADHVLEHLNDPFGVMKDLHRILKPGGILILRVPHFSRGFTHSDHRRGFDVSFPYYFNPSFSPGYYGFEFELRKLRLAWFAQPYMKRKVLSAPAFYLGLFLGAIFDIFANLAPFVCSRIWCFWVGGFEEITFHFKCRK